MKDAFDEKDALRPTCMRARESPALEQAYLFEAEREAASPVDELVGAARIVRAADAKSWGNMFRIPAHEFASIGRLGRRPSHDGGH